jgi:hypothetical protein
MPTGSEARVAEEARAWSELAGVVAPVERDIEDPAATERDVTGHDPSSDLVRRASRWGFVFGSYGLGDLVGFVAGLASAEAEAWAEDRPHHATRAYEDRRFLVGDRLIHWAVPWLDAAGRCYLEYRWPAHEGRDRLLELGDRLRIAPALTGREGLVPPGEDAFGPLTDEHPLHRTLPTLASGLVIFPSTLASLRGTPVVGREVPRSWLEEPAFRSDLAAVYEVAVGRWSSMANDHPGSARLWLDLAERAARTASLLG